ncbi:unnamed protein product [Strongylus vulgaris]|uniref:Peptidase S9 prolyl oligopeptidase catalytic domain-containing protein n=1 Tax=Strongylus vulgaris TaxID=40348 RepID=A0A3P7I4P7_STRVU|nr:unnamed protein product [Strongylus vulgaris]
MAPTANNIHLYSTKGSPVTDDVWKCLTCRFSNCTYQENKIQSNFEHVVIHCKGPAPHHYYLGDIVQGKIANWTQILVNEEYEDAISEVALPYVINEAYPLQQGFEALVKILLPPDQPSRSSSRSLPVLLKVYAGPGPQQATDEFSIAYEDYLAASRGYAVVTIDGRGATGRGWKYRSAFYGALGTVEIDDQIEGIR